MNCSAARELFPDLLDSPTRPRGRAASPAAPASIARATTPPPSSTNDLAAARAHLSGCLDCQREFSALSQTLAALDSLPTSAPSPRLRQNFYALLAAEKNSAATARDAAAAAHTSSAGTSTTHGHTPARLRSRLLPRLGGLFAPLATLAAIALLAAGFFLGQRAAPPSAPSASSASLPSSASPTANSAETLALRDEVRELRGHMGKMQQLVVTSLLLPPQGPVSTRFQEVLAAARTEQPDEKVLSVLINALAFDPSVNIRLRALEALYPQAANATVAAGVLATLPRETNPLVQIELIDFLTAARTPAAAPALEKMAGDDAIDRSVRAAARRALAQL
ncbi:MAG: hypothetical protein RLZZ15_2090 [Verrucomicrobiota bacterium]|jgi:hypothetical protein